ncbi:DUF5076 domain-containing protein [Caulobacter rhizosphaerae]|jgi:hypothetical protein|uniref:DUF5076 domain-containing protein n=1 Tax=Caulobacter rhizosphaerae TaxID=2010972 RepID=UPI0013D7C79D|nr:DUF5076 domain-containing protein [Caulobacter rhizosphaerae]GGL27628.1 DUF5076 domain-containing protein [Caulobacter rhizosphaerae]
MNVLGIPPAALRDAEALELARVWIAERGLHCSLRVGLYADDGASGETRAWAIILADMAGHIADALSAAGMGSRADLLDALADRFNAEVASPTSARRAEWGVEAS